MAWLTSPKHALLVCYHAELGRSASKDVGINTGERPQKLGSAGTPLSWGGMRG